MHDKVIQFQSVSSLGQVFAEAIDVTPRGGGLEKIAGDVHPEVRSYIRTLRPDPKYQYVLMTPMGAFEYWGMNVNGDVFPELSLSFDMHRGDPLPVAKSLESKWLAPFGKKVPPGAYREFGFKTFLNALRYRHHVNKNPEIAYGDITLAVWNPTMHRVEVVSRHDREKAKRVGAEEIILDLDAGKPRQISMGCKVPFDVCTKCGHISSTPRDYCDHLRLSMGSVNPDGSINGAVNFFPRFFDLSDVFVPAAKESGVLMKVAAARQVNKVATQNKKAEIQKTIAPNSGQPIEHQAVRDCCAAEPDLPPEMLRGGDFASLLTTLAALGIVLKPQEFQSSMLSRMGLGRYADELEDRNMCFDPVSTMGDSPGFSMERHYSPSLARMLESVLPERSGFYPHLPTRVLRIVIVRKPMEDTKISAPDSEPLRKVASAYASYRRAFRTLPQSLDVAVEADIDYYQRAFFRDLLVDSFEKTSSARHGFSLSTPLVPLYVYNAYQTSVDTPPPSWDFHPSPTSISKALLGPTL